MPTRQLGVALWEYRDHHTGRRRRAYYGEQFGLSADEEARGERAGVFADVSKPAEVANPIGRGGSVATREDSAGRSQPDERPNPPKLVAVKSIWVDYAETLGIARTETEGMTKRDLIAAVAARIENAGEQI